MSTVDPARGWWGEQCPGRGPSLSHAHGSECTERAHDGRCCSCLARPGERPTAQAVPAPINVNDRLRSLGLMPEPARPAVALTEDEIMRLEVNVLHIMRKRGYR